MTLDEPKELVDHLIERWSGSVEVCVSGKYLSTSKTIMGHYEPTTVGPVIFVTGKKRKRSQ